MSLLIGLLNAVEGEQWVGYLRFLDNPYDRIDFLTELLMVIKCGLPFSGITALLTDG